MENLTELFNLLSKSSSHTVIMANNTIKVQSHEEGTTNFSTIYQSRDNAKEFGVNFTVGTIKNPSKKAGSTLYNYLDKYFTSSEILKVVL